ncbi:glycosyltransferase [Geodermatophilus sp. CPCC 206100]|uniref:glycosyltransferase n=1 Tax=Geodermatophilus sp. CPCC 206100 TaxID=3020054 RepID=UPI003B007D91
MLLGGALSGLTARLVEERTEKAGQQHVHFRPLDILHITDNLELGGSQLVLVDLANEQVARGHSVAVAAGPGELWTELHPDIERFDLPGRHLPLPRALLAIRPLLRHRPWSVVHTHQRGVSAATWLARGRRPLAHVEHVHAIFTPASRRFLSFRGQALIAVGGGVASMLIDEYKRPSGRVFVVRNGVRDHGFRRSRGTPPGDALNLLNIARVDENKNPARFVEIVQELCEQGVPARGRWIGDGPLLGHARGLVARKGLEARVRFTGADRHAVAALAECDLFLLTSRQEGLPLSVIEACAAGVPVAAPDVGSLRDVVTAGQNGWLYGADESPRGIAAIISSAWRERTTLETLGARSREVYERGFRIDRVANEVQHVYDALLR